MIKYKILYIPLNNSSTYYDYVDLMKSEKYKNFHNPKDNKKIAALVDEVLKSEKFDLLIGESLQIKDLIFTYRGIDINGISVYSTEYKRHSL